MLPLIHLDQAAVDALTSRVPGGAADVPGRLPPRAHAGGHPVPPPDGPRQRPVRLPPAHRRRPGRVRHLNRRSAERRRPPRRDAHGRSHRRPARTGPGRTCARPPKGADRADAADSGAAERRGPRAGSRIGQITLTGRRCCAWSSPRTPHSQRRYLLLSAHHLIEDATSCGSSSHELAAHMAGRADQLPPAPAYRDFVSHTLPSSRAGDMGAHFRRTNSATSPNPPAPFQLVDVHGDGGRDARPAPLPARPPSRRHLRAQAQRLQSAPPRSSTPPGPWSRRPPADATTWSSVPCCPAASKACPAWSSARQLHQHPAPAGAPRRSAPSEDLVPPSTPPSRELIATSRARWTLAQRSSGLDGDATLFNSMINFRYFEPRQGDLGPATLKDLGIRWLRLPRPHQLPGERVRRRHRQRTLPQRPGRRHPLARRRPRLRGDAAVSGLVDALAADDGAPHAGARPHRRVLPAAERHRLLTEGGTTPTSPTRTTTASSELFREHVRQHRRHRRRTASNASPTPRPTPAPTARRAPGCASGVKTRHPGRPVRPAAPGARDRPAQPLKARRRLPCDRPGLSPERIHTLVANSGVGIVLSQSHLPSGPLTGADEDSASRSSHLDTGEHAGDDATLADARAT
ncbi:hypothetical protein LV779_34395 [Streptomyces thinghirensis]|nr:hypothetical protein [Streptomyces thinghirensis]